jgi:hypothetical protein
MSRDIELRAHQEWLGYLQPFGLVVSAAALRDSQAHVNKNIISEQESLISLVHAASAEIGKRAEEPPKRIRDFPAFAQKILAWEHRDLAGGPSGPDIPASLETPLADYGEVLKPTYAIPDPANAGTWLILIEVLSGGTSLDEVPEAEAHDKRWQASPQARFERLLRENQVPIGILTNGDVIRLVYSPRGESTGHLTFPVAAMLEVPGRPILAALHMLLSAERLFVVPTDQRLPALLQKSRKYQNEVSTKLAEQVLRALNELMRGFQSANEATQGELLRQVLQKAPEQVYGGLLTTLMRLVFILYAEDRGLLSTESLYVESYSISGLFERLREDAAQFPDTMDQRFGAWAQILTLGRLIHDGGGHGALHLPARRGRLFDPDAYPFLEGRPYGSTRDSGEAIYPPRVSDGVVFRVLQDLLILDGDRLSYSSLDVEQIGSVYEAMMGFVVQTAGGPSIGLKPDHVVVNLTELLKRSAADRPKWLKEQAAAEVTGKALDQLKTAAAIDDVVAAFGRKISPLYLDGRGLPLVIASEGLYLQPTEERRRSGSHYTPRSLTEPIVRTTLEPILKRLGDKPRPEQILELKVCDPAMGSGAFLVETCRYLAEALVESWSAHADLPIIPPDQEAVLHARRLIAQRCLYGVDKNPFAVDLAKLSLWLATLAKDHPFTFLDHSLRCGDSLVGLSRQQIMAFHWLPAKQQNFLEQELRQRIDRVSQFRRRILAARDEVPYEQLRQQLDSAEDALFPLRRAGDVVVSAFFSADNSKGREHRRREAQATVEGSFKHPGQTEYEDALDLLLAPNKRDGLIPFHWELEFPEVFGADSPGLDCLVGNPPFLGGTRISTSLSGRYLDYLKTTFDESGNRMDLVAYFFRRAYLLLRREGTIGLIATNTISQGDTRKGGLGHLCRNGASIYWAIKRFAWPGRAAVTVSIVCLKKGPIEGIKLLDGKPVEMITAFLFHAGSSNEPATLSANEDLCFEGFKLASQGFLFDNNDPEASSIETMNRIVALNPENQPLIHPYIGGEEVNTSPRHAFHRYAINFGSMTPEEAARWPELFAIVREKVKPGREKANRENHRKRWWQYGEVRPGLLKGLSGKEFVLVCSRVQQNWAVARLSANQIFAESLDVFALPEFAAFAVLQSRIHEVWIRFFASTLEDRLRYTPTDCFETFPFPMNWRTDTRLEEAGRQYHQYRAEWMIANNQGLTATYNSFNNPQISSTGIVELRRLHSVMDRVVLDSYDWFTLHPTHDFVLDYEVADEEDESSRTVKRPWRYRWTDDIREDVLARLLKLNREVSDQEKLSTTLEGPSKPKGSSRSKVKLNANAPMLFSKTEVTD